MSRINMNPTVVDDEEPVSPTTHTLGDDEWLMVAVNESNVNDTAHPEATDTGTVNSEPKVTKDEVEILKEVLESTRAAFRAEHETTQHTQARLAAVMQEVKSTKDTAEKDVKEVKLQLAAAKENSHAPKTQLEAMNYTLKEKLHKFKAQAASAAILFEKVKRDLQEELEEKEVQLSAARKELEAARAELVSARAESTATKKDVKAKKQELQATKDQLVATMESFAAAKKEWVQKQAATINELQATKRAHKATKGELFAAKDSFEEASKKYVQKQLAKMKELEETKRAHEATKVELESSKQKLRTSTQELETSKRENTTAREKLVNELRVQVEAAYIKHETARKEVSELWQKHRTPVTLNAEQITKKEKLERDVTAAATEVTQQRSYAFDELKWSYDAQIRKEGEQRTTLDKEAANRMNLAAEQLAAAKKKLRELMQKNEREGAVEVQFWNGRPPRPYGSGTK
ncbi:hypothetical protein L207DRAFT_565684 [Hyaloscypha variabilis F]|uniref:Uncharacterized protein n=1 Tax=Hyaloscypha variabilis (strain UAMH 11265 / GT02V1 / F) TaxID=1149755 RepID=A0A2J6RTV8_HYAVF|nr:hypothetical protein L207DRAFT_565684 [Hyaloscypha variabilis F]